MEQCYIAMVSSVAVSVPPASAALNRKASAEESSEKGGTTTQAPRATVAFAQEKEGFDIPTAEEILSREEHPSLFSDFNRSLPPAVTKVRPCWHV